MTNYEFKLKITLKKIKYQTHLVNIIVASMSQTLTDKSIPFLAGRHRGWGEKDLSCCFTVTCEKAFDLAPNGHHSSQFPGTSMG